MNLLKGIPGIEPSFAGSHHGALSVSGSPGKSWNFLRLSEVATADRFAKFETISLGASGTQMFSSQAVGISLVPRFRGRSRTLYICGMKEAWVRELLTKTLPFHPFKDSIALTHYETMPCFR